MANPASQNRDRRDESLFQRLFGALSYQGDVYEPREDSLLMLETLEAETLHGKELLDVGCGSGVLSLFAASKGAKVTACDVDDLAIENVIRAARKLGLNVRAVVSDAWSSISESFDVVLMNPPYLPSDHFGDAAVDGGRDGIAIVERFADELPSHLHPGGFALVLVSSVTSWQQVFKPTKFEVTLVGRKRLFFEELNVLRIKPRV